MEILLVPPPLDVEVDPLEVGRHLAYGTLAHLAVVDLDDRGDMGGGSRHETLLSQKELAAIDVSLHSVDAELGLGQLHHGIPGDALQNAVLTGRGDKLAIDDEEDILTSPLGDIAVRHEHDSLIEPTLHSVRLGDGVVYISASDLPARGYHSVVDPAPRRRAALYTFLRIEIGAEKHYRDKQAILETVKAVFDLYAPVSGDVVERNGELESNPDLIKQEPYGNGWMLKIKPTDEDELNELMTADEYEKFIEEQK